MELNIALQGLDEEMAAYRHDLDVRKIVVLRPICLGWSTGNIQKARRSEDSQLQDWSKEQAGPEKEVPEELNDKHPWPHFDSKQRVSHWDMVHEGHPKVILLRRKSSENVDERVVVRSQGVAHQI